MDAQQQDLTAVDESAFTAEPSILGVATYSDRVALIGDAQQLPPTSGNSQMQRSLHERLGGTAGFDPVMLTQQFRMVAQIAKWPGDFFYESKLVSMRGDSKPGDLSSGFFWPFDSPLAFVNVVS